MPGRPVHMSHSDSRYDFANGGQGPHQPHHTNGLPVYTHPRKNASTAAPGAVPFKAPGPMAVNIDRNEHTAAASGAGRRSRRRGRRRRGSRSRKDRQDKQETTQEKSTEISEQTFGRLAKARRQLTPGSQSASPSSSLCGSPPHKIVKRPDAGFGSSIQVPDPSVDHLNDTYASATQRWLSSQHDMARMAHGSLEHDEDHFKGHREDAKKPAPRRPRPAFLGCHLPIPATEVAETKPFPFDAPVYTAEELSLPRPYNADYPHPLTVYASPAVNPAAVAESGYAPLLKRLQDRPEEMMGHILAECGKPNVTALGLTLDRDSKEGCGIPEKFWLRLSSWDGVKVPLGAVVPFARSTRGVAPRLATSRPETAQPSTAFPESPTPDVQSRSETDLVDFAALARRARRASADGLKPLALAQVAERRGSLPNLSRLQSTRETSLPVPPRHAYAPPRKIERPQHSASAPPMPSHAAHAQELRELRHDLRPVSKSQPLSPVPETESLDPIGAERKLLRKTRPPALGLQSLPLAGRYDDILSPDPVELVLDGRRTSVRRDVRAEEILTPLHTPQGPVTPLTPHTPHTPRTPLPVTARTPLTPCGSGPYSASALSTTFEFSAGKSIWS